METKAEKSIFAKNRIYAPTIIYHIDFHITNIKCTKGRHLIVRWCRSRLRPPRLPTGHGGGRHPTRLRGRNIHGSYYRNDVHRRLFPSRNQGAHPQGTHGQTHRFIPSGPSKKRRDYGYRAHSETATQIRTPQQFRLLENQILLLFQRHESPTTLLPKPWRPPRPTRDGLRRHTRHLRPVLIDSTYYFDGFFHDNMPVQPLIEEQCDRRIGSYIILEHNGKTNNHRRLWMHAYNYIAFATSQKSIPLLTDVITIDPGNIWVDDFKKLEELYQIGYQAGKTYFENQISSGIE